MGKGEYKSMWNEEFYRDEGEKEGCVRFKESNKQWTQEKMRWQALDFMPGHGLVFLEMLSLQTISQERSGAGMWKERRGPLQWAPLPGTLVHLPERQL